MLPTAVLRAVLRQPHLQATQIFGSLTVRSSRSDSDEQYVRAIVEEEISANDDCNLRDDLLLRYEIIAVYCPERFSWTMQFARSAETVYLATNQCETIGGKS